MAKRCQPPGAGTGHQVQKEGGKGRDICQHSSFTCTGVCITSVVQNILESMGRSLQICIMLKIKDKPFGEYSYWYLNNDCFVNSM